jgi:hypothetical protein
VTVSELERLEVEAGRICPFHAAEHRAGRLAGKCGERRARMRREDPEALAECYRDALARIDRRNEERREQERVYPRKVREEAEFALRRSLRAKALALPDALSPGGGQATVVDLQEVLDIIGGESS